MPGYIVLEAEQEDAPFLLRMGCRRDLCLSPLSRNCATLGKSSDRDRPVCPRRHLSELFAERFCLGAGYPGSSARGPQSLPRP